MKYLKDIIALIISIGLLAIIGFVAVGDFVVALRLGRPVDSSVINLLQMSITGMIGIIAGYIGGKVSNKENNNG